MCRNLCRLCANETVENTALKLFERRHRELLAQLKEITGVLLKNSSGLPKLMCSNCIKSLKDAYEFRENVLKTQALLKTKLWRTDEKEQQLEEDNVVEATEFVQVCYVKDEKDPNIGEIHDVEEKEIDINDTQTTDRKEETFIENYTSEINALDIKSTEIAENALEEVKITVGQENREENNISPDNNINNDDDGEHFSEVSSEMNEVDHVEHDDEARPLTPPKKVSRPRNSTHKKAKTKKQNVMAKVSKEAISKPKENKPRKRRKDAEDHPNVFICDQCGNHFTCRHHFKLHLRRHTGDKQCACELCPDKFFTSSELRRHMRKHTGERPFACKYCERRFTDYSTRIKHERTHTNERPFMCSQCGKSFTTSYILKNHMLTHTGERHFKCSVCDKAFTRRTHLVVHFRSIMHKQAVEKEKQLNLQDPQTLIIASSSLAPTFLV